MTLKALVADDDDLMRTFIVLTLGTVGVTDVVEARDGDEALALIEREDFDLILVDRYMPGKSGIEVIGHVRAAGSSVPIIMVTAEAERDQVLKAIRLGASDYLIKPFEAATLRMKVEKVMKGQADPVKKAIPGRP